MDAMVSKQPVTPDLGVRQLTHWLEQLYETHWTDRSPAKGLTLRQFDVLLSTDLNSGASQTILVGSTSVDRSTLADIARRLTRKGLVERRRTKEDLRAYAVKLTAQGEAQLKAARKVEAQLDDSVLGPLSASERAQLLKILNKLRNAHEKLPRRK